MTLLLGDVRMKHKILKSMEHNSPPPPILFWSTENTIYKQLGGARRVLLICLD